MIHAKPNQWFKNVWRMYNRYYLLYRHFSKIHMKGLVDLPSTPQTRPIIYIANHSNWWDGLLAYEAYMPRSSKQHFIMMEEQQLRQFRFFSRLGVFSVNKQSSSDLMKSLNYAIQLLHNQHAVWIFPQGKIEHPEKRPLQFFSGVAYLLQRCPDAVVIPVTMVYSFCHQQKPAASIWFGHPLKQQWSAQERGVITDHLRQLLEQQLAQHRQADIEQQLEILEFQSILRTKTTDEWFVIAKKWVKSWFMRS